MSLQWYTHPDPEAAAEACARHISALLEEALAGQERATLAVSGGSTPKLLFRQLVASGFRWDRVHLFWVDERSVPPDDPESNYRLAEENLIAPARIPPAQVHRIHAELPPEAAAQRYIEEIRSFFGLREGEQPHFDVVQCGMGPDAHTASLFPGEPLQLPDSEAGQQHDAREARRGRGDQPRSAHGPSNRPGAALFLYCEAINSPFSGRKSPRQTRIVTGAKITT